MRPSLYIIATYDCSRLWEQFTSHIVLELMLHCGFMICHIISGVANLVSALLLEHLMLPFLLVAEFEAFHLLSSGRLASNERGSNS